ncbi:hypothetical protein GW17_00030871 [Ensete ventricosum]|nr:hypothetical protein GW17_00030871 [Ensete ventricosum]RZR93706.1 hypothetical protein BHM03_00022269 [Ensete ventricosum]
MGNGAEDEGPPVGSSPPPPPLEWKFSQVFGERAAGEEVQEAMSMSLFLNDILFCSLSFVLLIFVAFMSVQVQEKKVKKIAEMNVDASQAVQNDNIASSSTISPRGYLPNGGCPERPHGRLNNELSMPPGGFPSLHLPVVVVLSQAYCS